MLLGMLGMRLEPDLISHNAGMSACEKGTKWSHGLTVLRMRAERCVEPDVKIYNTSISTCEKGQK